MPLEKSQERPSLSENTERLSRPGLRLTDELELRFLENLREHGRTKGTISTYRRNLSKLRKSLPEDSNLTPAFLSNWQSELLEQGYSPGTVNSCTATVNSLLEFAGRRDLQAGQLPLNEGTLLPELTRNEYLRLLQTAKLLGKRQTYLLVLLFGTMDLLPLTGVTFPFLSNGGSSMLASWGLIAFLKAADTRQNASFAVRTAKAEEVEPLE